MNIGVQRINLVVCIPKVSTPFDYREECNLSNPRYYLPNIKSISNGLRVFDEMPELFISEVSNC